MKLLDDKPLPHDLEAEANVLGCILMGDGLIEKAQQIFNATDVFYDRKHQLIYEAMIKLNEQHLSLDLVNLRYNLKESGHLDLVGEDYLISLEDSVPHGNSFPYYVEQILKHYTNRKKILAASKIIENAYKGADVDTAELIPLLESHNTNSSGIIRPSDIENEVRELHKNGGLKRGVSTGWQSVDPYYTVLPGLLTIITGIPSHGKSTWLLNLHVNLSIRHDWKFAVFSPENQPLQRYVAQILSLYAGKSFCTLSPEEFEYSWKWVQNHFIFLQPPDDEMTVDHLVNKAKFCVEKYKINGFVIDPWNEIDHRRPDNLTETEHVSDCLSKLKRLAQIQNIHVWLVAHPTKLQKRTDGTYGVPTPYDISGSAHFRNKADVCLCVWRDVLADDGITELHVQKIRFREVGKIGMVQLRYDYHTGKYECIF